MASSGDVSAGLSAVRAACAAQARRATPGIDDMGPYLAEQVADESHRDVVGPLLPGSGPSGIVRRAGREIGSWGDPSVPEMLFSATKSVVSLVAGVAYDRGLLHPDAVVTDTVRLEALDGGGGDRIRWVHLLQQTSGWDGELWGKPASVDAQSRPAGGAPSATGVRPGQAWAYNDVRVNLLYLALTALLDQPLPEVLAEAVMVPLGGSSSWSWHGYRDAVLDRGGRRLAVVSGGAHWGGGLWMSAADLALIGELYLARGQRDGVRVVSQDWVTRSWQPCGVRPDYGHLWWLNDAGTVLPAAPRTGRAARGNAGRHLLWVDPARDLVIVSHWGDQVQSLVSEVSAAYQPH